MTTTKTENVSTFTPFELSFFVTGIPKGQPRPRAFFNKKTGRASVFDAGTAEHWKQSIAVAAKEAVLKHEKTSNTLRAFPFFVQDWMPLEVTLQFYFPRPKGHFKKSGALREDMPTFHTGKPDNDNLEKAVFDALTQMQIWQDDKLIAKNRTSKRYASEDTPAGCKITIKELGK